jgi:hypothetical protein
MAAKTRLFLGDVVVLGDGGHIRIKQLDVLDHQFCDEHGHWYHVDQIVDIIPASRAERLRAIGAFFGVSATTAREYLRIQEERDD